VNPAGRAPLIARYREGPRRVRDALEGITEAELDVRPAPDAWTVREVVHHLPDSEMTSAIRLRRLLAEDAPTLGGYDEEQFARTLRYAERPIDAALDLFDLIRRVTAEILERMTEEEWSVQLRDLAGDLRGARPRACRPDPSGTRGRRGPLSVRVSVPQVGDRLGDGMGQRRSGRILGGGDSGRVRGGGGERLLEVAVTLAAYHGADDEHRPGAEEDRERTDQGEQLDGALGHRVGEDRLCQQLVHEALRPEHACVRMDRLGSSEPFDSTEVSLFCRRAEPGDSIL
jgi:hypothetical protein